MDTTVESDATECSDSSDSDREEFHNPENDRTLTEMDPLKPHGTSWNVQSEIDMNFDQGWHSNHQIAWVAGTPVLAQRTPLHYFEIMFPVDEANDWIMKTNSSLLKLNRRSQTKCEYFIFAFGV